MPRRRKFGRRKGQEGRDDPYTIHFLTDNSLEGKKQQAKGKLLVLMGIALTSGFQSRIRRKRRKARDMEVFNGDRIKTARLQTVLSPHHPVYVKPICF